MLFRRVKESDVKEIDQLFRACLTDLVTREKKEMNLIEEEVANLNQTLQESLAGEYDFFVAELNGRISGTIALTKPNSHISENILVEPNVFEVGCVYVHPDDQRQGIGKFMFQQIKQELSRLGQTRYYLDAGFSSSQQYWEKVLGKPSFVIENFWGEREHHLIWQQNV